MLRSSLFVALALGAPWLVVGLLDLLAMGFYAHALALEKSALHAEISTSPGNDPAAAQATLTLYGAVGGTLAASLAGLLVASGSGTALLLSGVLYAVLGVLPLFLLAGALPALPANHDRDLRTAVRAGAGGLVRVGLVALLVAGLEPLAIGLVALWFSPAWVGPATGAFMLGQLLAARLSAWVNTSPRSDKLELLVLAVGVLPWALASRSVWLLLAAQVTLGAALRGWQASREAWALSLPVGPTAVLLALMASRFAGAAGSAWWLGIAIGAFGAGPVVAGVALSLGAAGASRPRWPRPRPTGVATADNETTGPH